MTETTRRPIMTAAELAGHHTIAHGRDYTVSCDGEEDMEQAEKQGWTLISSWGRDGWNLGDWPYIAISTRISAGRFELQQVVEGDYDLYQFGSYADLEAAIDYLFLWYAAGSRWAPLNPSDRAALNAGELTVDEKFRGPCTI
jgi:hypothetical protein